MRTSKNIIISKSTTPNRVLLEHAKIREVERLARSLLSKPWKRLDWDMLRDNSEWSQPGVYALAYARSLRIKRPIDDLSSIFYVGMSRAVGGIRGRLGQFLNGIEKNGYHSAAMRFFREYANGVPYSEWSARKNFFAVALAVPCEVTPGVRTGSDLRRIGHVVCLEYYVRALIKERTDAECALNKQ